MKLKCLVLDDSSIQRMIVSKLVENHLSLSLVGDFSNAVEAKNFMSYNEVDLLFLDIEMPIVSGFDFLDGLKIKPQVIFVTSKSDYDATDYLQKPITNTRFEAAIKRATAQSNLVNDALNTNPADYIVIKSKLKKFKIHIPKIRWVEAFGDYVKVVTDTDSHLVLSTMKAMEVDLNNKKFLRVHKSFIVNIERIDRFNSKIAEIGDAKIPLSRNKKDDLVKAFEEV
jgi:DNA-binding LytR/AlgR family response regulator